MHFEGLIRVGLYLLAAILLGTRAGFTRARALISAALAVAVHLIHREFLSPLFWQTEFSPAMASAGKMYVEAQIARVLFELADPGRVASLGVVIARHSLALVGALAVSAGQMGSWAPPAFYGAMAWFDAVLALCDLGGGLVPPQVVAAVWGLVRVVFYGVALQRGAFSWGVYTLPYVVAWAMQLKILLGLPLEDAKRERAARREPEKDE